MNKSNHEIIELSNQIQTKYPSIKSLVFSFRQTKYYKSPTKSKVAEEIDVFNRLLKLLEPINKEAIEVAKELGVTRNDLLTQLPADIKIATAVVAAAKLPPDESNGTPKFELRF